MCDCNACEADAERLLTEWAENFRSRDALVLVAHRAGVSKRRIHALTGIARTTLDRILSREVDRSQSADLPWPCYGHDQVVPLARQELARGSPQGRPHPATRPAAHEMTRPRRASREWGRLPWMS